MNKFWNQVESDYNFRTKHYVVIKTSIFIVVLVLSSLFLLWKNTIHFDFWTSFGLVMLITCAYQLIKREGYREGYFDGGGDIGNRANYQIDYDKDHTDINKAYETKNKS